MWGQTAWAQLNAPVRLTRRSRSQRSRRWSANCADVVQGARVVDEDVDRAELVGDLRDRCSDLVTIGDVAAHRERAAPKGLDLVDRRLGVHHPLRDGCLSERAVLVGRARVRLHEDVGDRDVRPGPGQRQRIGAPEPARAPGDERDAPRQVDLERHGAILRRSLHVRDDHGACRAVDQRYGALVARRRDVRASVAARTSSACAERARCGATGSRSTCRPSRRSRSSPRRADQLLRTTGIASSSVRSDGLCTASHRAPTTTSRPSGSHVVPRRAGRFIRAALAIRERHRDTRGSPHAARGSAGVSGSTSTSAGRGSRAVIGSRRRTARHPRCRRGGRGAPLDRRGHRLPLHLGANTELRPRRPRAGLYEPAELVRMLGMRRTLWVVPRDLVPVVDAACTRVIAARERRRLEGFVAASGVAGEPGRWIDDVATATLRALQARGEAFTSELSRDDPLLATKLRLGAGTRWEAEVSAASRILPLLAAEGAIVRGRPAAPGSTASTAGSPSRTGWAASVDEIEPAAAQAELAPPLAPRVRTGDRDRSPLVGGLDCAGGASRPRRRPPRGRRSGRRGTGFVLADDLDPTERPEPWATLLPDTRSDDHGLEGARLVPRPARVRPVRLERQRWPDRLVGRSRCRRLVAAQGRRDRLRAARGRRPRRRLAVEAEAARLEAWLGDVRISPGFLPPFQRSARDLIDGHSDGRGSCGRKAVAVRDLPRRRRGSERRDSASAESRSRTAQPRKISLAITSRWICEVPS